MLTSHSDLELQLYVLNKDPEFFINPFFWWFISPDGLHFALTFHCWRAADLTTISALFTGQREKWKLVEFTHRTTHFSALLWSRGMEKKCLGSNIYYNRSPGFPSANMRWPNLMASVILYHSQEESFMSTAQPEIQTQSVLLQTARFLTFDLCLSSTLSSTLSFALGCNMHMCLHVTLMACGKVMSCKKMSLCFGTEAISFCVMKSDIVFLFIWKIFICRGTHGELETSGIRTQKRGQDRTGEGRTGEDRTGDEGRGKILMQGQCNLHYLIYCIIHI